MQLLEQFLVRLDSGPWSALWRVMLGFAIAPVCRVISGSHDHVWVEIALFVALLIGLRVIPALVRGVLPFSADTKATWFQRRQIAKLHDSYQWQKLFWIGLGLLAFDAVDGGLETGDLAITAFCLIGGSAGLLLWRRSKVGVAIV